MATEQEVIKELRTLEPDRWVEVLDFIGYLKRRSLKKRSQAHVKQLTARELARSNVVGLWADRRDIGDSVAFARRLRKQAESRGAAHDSA